MHMPARATQMLLSTVVVSQLLQCSLASSQTAKRPDLVISNFNGERYAHGWTTTGTAFGSGPAHGQLAGQNPVAGYEGVGLVNSFLGGDASTGTLTSPSFLIERNYIQFLIGGGSKSGLVSLNLLVDGKVVRRATGNNSEQLHLVQWKVTDLKGRLAQMEIIDRAAGGWGHILVDDIRQTDDDGYADGASIARAMSATQQALQMASTDSRRPVYHFHPPAQWMNDPNGFIHVNGWYHLFYQFNPYSTEWGHMHWGHARSRDLVNWEHLPIALWPSEDRGEEHVFSGSIVQDGEGESLIFYTSIAPSTSPRDPEVWAAAPVDPDLIAWRKLKHEPVISQKVHEPVRVDEWRDPFLFSEDGVDYMLIGGEIDGRGVVCLYQAENKQLSKWKFRGSFFDYPDPSVKNIECPNLIKVAGRWVLLISVNNQVEYYTGTADMNRGTFDARKHGVLNEGSYASQATYDEHGRNIVLAWVRPIGGPGWSGCMSLPLNLAVRSDWTLISTPIDAVTRMETSTVTVSDVPVSEPTTLLPGAIGDAWRIKVFIETGTASEVDLILPVTASGDKAVRVRYNCQSRVLSIPGLKALVLPQARQDGILDLDLFLDKSLLDVFINGGEICGTGVFEAEPAVEVGVQATVVGGDARIRQVSVHKMSPAQFDLSHFTTEAR